MRLACVTIPNFRIALERTRARATGAAHERVSATTLIGRPVAIGEPPPGANEIIDCSPEAAALRIRPGMPLRDARTLVPDLILLPPDPVYYGRAFDSMLDALEDTQPQIEPGDLGTVFTTLAIDPLLCVTFSPEQSNTKTPSLQSPVSSLQPEHAAVARLLDAVRQSAGVEASAGAAEGKFVAWIAATISVPGEVTVVPAGREADFLAPLSTAFLPVSYDTHRKLANYALPTIGDVARLPIGALQSQFRGEGRRLYELARGIDSTPFLPRTRAEPIVGTIQMPAPTVNSNALLIGARQLVGRLLQRPDMHYRQVRQLRLRLVLLDGGSWEHTLTFRDPLGDEEGITFVLKKLIEPLQLAGPVEEMMLEFIGLTEETGKQRSLLFAEQARRRAQLFAALRQLKAHFGDESPQVSRIVEVEPWSRIPERRYALIDYDL